MLRPSNFRSSTSDPASASRACPHGETIDEILARRRARRIPRAIRVNAALPQPRPHRPSLAAYFPAPSLRFTLAAEDHEVEGPAGRWTQHGSYRRTCFDAVLQPVADARLSDEQAGIVGIGL